jgi:hypothetical protein
MGLFEELKKIAKDAGVKGEVKVTSMAAVISAGAETIDLDINSGDSSAAIKKRFKDLLGQTVVVSAKTQPAAAVPAQPVVPPVASAASATSEQGQAALDKLVEETWADDTSALDTLFTSGRFDALVWLAENNKRPEDFNSNSGPEGANEILARLK